LCRKIHTFPASLENALKGKQKIKKKCSSSNTSKKWVFHISHFCYHNHQKVKKNQKILCTQKARQVVILKYLKKLSHPWKNERNTATLSLEVEKVTFIGAGRKLIFSRNFFFP
jgi:hypothetical protein